MVSENGRESIAVLTRTPVETWELGKTAEIPLEVGGVPVNVIVTGEISAPIRTQGAGAMVGAQEFNRPVPIGVSVSNASGATGTIGARVIQGADTLALSNAHVFTSMFQGETSSSIIQPGLVDGGSEPEDVIGTLSVAAPIDFSGACVNTIDAALAFSSSDDLHKKTPDDGYGIPRRNPVFATPGLHVQKYGRTTGLTFGDVVAVNATVEVSYGNLGVACFTDQLIISSGEFSRGGDSGSLVVSASTDAQNDVRPVGLVFAGSETVTVANDISRVLAEFNVTIDGKSSPAEDPVDDSGVVDDGDSTIVANPQSFSEIFLRVEDTSGTLVDNISVCAYDSATGAECGESADSVLERAGIDANWTAELEGGEDDSIVTLSQNTQYIIMTDASSNAVYYYYEYGDTDVEITLTVTDTNTGAGSFTDINIIGTADAEIVSTEISNVSITTPVEVGTASTISWDADWSGDGTYSYPDWISTKSTIKLNDGGNLSTIDGSESQAGGSGNYSWTPSSTGSGLKVRVTDRSSDDWSESASFSVDNAALSVDFTGPSVLDATVEGTWTAQVSGGTTPYTYDWDYMLTCSKLALPVPLVEECDTWNQGGTGVNWSHTVSGDEYDLKIRLTVSDSDSPSNSKQKSKIVGICPYSGC